MNEFINKIYRNNTIIYKVILFLITTIAIVYLFPKGGQFKYEFSNGQLWKYDNLYAPFDFAIQKNEEEISNEKKEIEANAKLYFEYNITIVSEVKNTFYDKINEIVPNDSLKADDINSLKKIGDKVLQKVYDIGFLGVISEDRISRKDEIIALKKRT